MWFSAAGEASSAARQSGSLTQTRLCCFRQRPLAAPWKPTRARGCGRAARSLRRPAGGAGPGRGAGRRSSQPGLGGGRCSAASPRRLPAQVGPPAGGGEASEPGAGGEKQPPGAERSPPPQRAASGPARGTGWGRAARVGVPGRGRLLRLARRRPRPPGHAGTTSRLARGPRGTAGGGARGAGLPRSTLLSLGFRVYPWTPSPS